MLGVTSFDSKCFSRTTNCTHIYNIFKLNSTTQVSTNMSRTFRLFQTNHLPDKDVFMEVPDVEKINENSKKKKNQDLLRTKVTLKAGLPASSTIDFSFLEAFC